MIMGPSGSVPMLFPVEPSEFWSQMRTIIQQEVQKISVSNAADPLLTYTPGLTEKPLYKINEVCTLFNISRTTIYDWIKHGKLCRVKIRSRVYFLGNDVKELMEGYDTQ